MVTHFRRYTQALLLACLFALVSIGLHTTVASAEGDNEFPGITEPSNDWNYAQRSPDPNLTWLYKANSSGGRPELLKGTGASPSKTTHVLRNRTIGRNEGTRLRVYYKKKPVQASVTISVIACELEANGNFAGRLQVDFGGDRVYNQPTQGKKVVEEQRRFGWQLTDPDPEATHRYTLQLESETIRDEDRPDADSPVCRNFNNTYPSKRFNEGCNNKKNGRCKGPGNGTYTQVSSTTKTLNNDGTPVGSGPNQYAVRNTLSGRTFSINFPQQFGPDNPGGLNRDGDVENEIGYDPANELYYADLDVDLTDNGGDASRGGVSPSMMQRITFNVIGNSVTAANGTSAAPLMGYRKFGGEDNAWRFFGLQGNGGRDNDFPGYGQKYAIPFGMECGVPSQTGKKVMLYDPDTRGYGAVYAMVFRRNPENGNVVRLPMGDYKNLNSFTRESNRLRTQGSGSGTTSWFEMDLEQGWQYMLVVVNPHAAAQQDPSSNVFSVRLPADSINGLMNCRFNLNPNLTDVPSDFSVYGDTLTGVASITNMNRDSVAGKHDWRIIKAVFRSQPRDSRDRQSDIISPMDPCDFVASTKGTAVLTPGGCNAEFYKATYVGDVTHPFSDTFGAQDPGTYVCYMVAVKNPTWQDNDDNSWRYSPMQCSVAGIKPKVQVWGGDAKAAGIIQTTVTDLTHGQNRRYGSWGEYGVFSAGKNQLMGSGAALANQPSKSGRASWNDLTFANYNAPTTLPYGFYENNLVAPEPSQTVAASRTGDITVSSIDDLISRMIPGNSLGSLIAAGDARKTFVVNGQLRISGNLTYPAAVSTIRNIPRITVIATAGVVVNRNVSQIDVAIHTNRLSTCDWVVRGGSNYFVALSEEEVVRSDVCNTQLRFNSPVVAEHLYLYRTFDSPAGDAAEIFNLRADNILSSYVGGGIDEPVATTNSVTDTPPRF